jgi:pantoate kinase
VTASRALRVHAFAPAHVTGIFAPEVRSHDPRARGSTGAGVVLELGVHATAEFRPGATSSVRLLADVTVPLPISEEVARRLRPRTPGRLTVRLRHQLPIGQGFGMSAAGASATALAVAGVARRTRSQAMETAHLADLFGGGGLGGVAGIAGGGGLEFRTRPGIPPWGRVLHRDLPGTVLVGVTGGPLPSPRLLRSPGFLRRVAEASEPLDSLLRLPSPTHFFAASERFTDGLGLAPPPLARTLRALRRRGAWAAQSMFGRSFFARPKNGSARHAVIRWLERAGVPALELASARRGAHVVTGAGSSPRPGTGGSQPF